MAVRELAEEGVENLVNATIGQLQIDLEDGGDTTDVKAFLAELIRGYGAQNALIKYATIRSDLLVPKPGDHDE